MHLLDKYMCRAATLFWILLCMSFTIDTRLFVYPSLSQSLLGEVVILLLNVLVLVHCLLHRTRLLTHRLQWFILAWMAFLWLHSVLIADAEVYKLSYALSMLSLLITLPYLLRQGFFSERSLENGILLMVVIQLLYLLLQWIGAMDSVNHFFPLTGTNDNPNVTAILLAVSLPMLFHRHRTGLLGVMYIVIILLVFIFLIALKCRTAYIALVVILVLSRLKSGKVKIFISGLGRLKAIILLLGVSIVLLLAAYGLYWLKPASANGRLLIWKISALMISEHPMGIGIGMFEHDYNLRQGLYFESGAASESEQQTADIVCMAYNDYLEQGVETGIIGILFLVAFYASVLWLALREHEIAHLGMIVAFAIMSTMNFVCATMQPWLVLTMVASLCLSSVEGNVKRPSNDNLPVSLIALCLCLWGGTHICRLTLSQLKLNRLKEIVKHRGDIDIAEASALALPIGTSEAYWRFMYKQYFQRKEYDKALACIRTASQYTTSTYVWFSQFYCLDCMGRPEEGIPCIEQVRNMIPQNLTSRHILLNWYHRQDDTLQALRMAEEIVDIPVKVRSERALSLQDNAMKYIKMHQIEYKR